MSATKRLVEQIMEREFHPHDFYYDPDPRLLDDITRDMAGARAQYQFEQAALEEQMVTELKITTNGNQNK